MKAFVYSLLLLIAPSLLLADTDFKNAHGDFFKLYNPDRTDIRLGYLYELDGKEKDGPGEYDLLNPSFDFLLQMPIDQNSFFSFGGEFEQRRYLFNPVDGAATKAGSENLYAIDFSPGYGYFISDDALIWAQATIGSYSDLEGGMTDTDDYQLLGKATLIFRLNPGAQIVLGASYTNDYIDDHFLPIIGLRLMSDTGKFSLAFDLPFFARAGYYISPEIELFTQLVVTGDKYNANINGVDLDVLAHDERAGVGVRFWIFDKISLTFEGGSTIGSELKFDKKNAGQFTTDDVDPHFYARSTLGWPL